MCQSTPAVFKVKEKVLGRKKDADEPSVIRDPETNELIFNPSEILQASADYCKMLLTNREPRKGFEEDLKWKRIVHNVRMKESVANDLEFSEEMFYNSFSILKKTKGEKYKFILKGGSSLQNALMKLYRTVWEQEKKPDSWRDSILIQLNKERQSQARK